MQQQAEQFPQPTATPRRASRRPEELAQLMRRARHRRRATLEDASHETRISVTYLSALEAGAPLSAFPAPVYARGFLREYARYLGLDPEPILEGFWEGHSVPDPVVTSAMAMPSGTGDRPRGFRQLRQRAR